MSKVLRLLNPPEALLYQQLGSLCVAHAQLLHERQ